MITRSALDPAEYQRFCCVVRPQKEWSQRKRLHNRLQVIKVIKYWIWYVETTNNIYNTNTARTEMLQRHLKIALEKPGNLGADNFFIFAAKLRQIAPKSFFPDNFSILAAKNCIHTDKFYTFEVQTPGYFWGFSTPSENMNQKSTHWCLVIFTSLVFVTRTLQISPLWPVSIIVRSKLEDKEIETIKINDMFSKIANNIVLLHLLIVGHQQV